MSEIFIVILNPFRHFYWKIAWRFPKCAECGRFHFPTTRCNSSDIFWRSSRSSRFRSNYTELSEIYRSLFIAQDDIINSGCETRRAGHRRIFKLSFRSNSRTFGELPNATHPHERESHRNPKIFSRHRGRNCRSKSKGNLTLSKLTRLSSRDSSRTYLDNRYRTKSDRRISLAIPSLPHIALIKSLFIDKIN